VDETLVQAAGGVVWRDNDGTTEVAVVHRPRYDDWSLPKGKAIPGEHPLDTARREVREETGIHPVLGPRLPTQRYRSPTGAKIVRFWAMSGRPGEFTSTAEVDDAVWLPVPVARRALTHQRDVTVLDALTSAVTVDAAVLLVRHAGVATRRRRCPAPDGLGQRRARALRRLLPGFAPGRLVCVPGDRRRDTLAPLANRVRLPVTYEPGLLGMHHGHPCAGARTPQAQVVCWSSRMPLNNDASATGSGSLVQPVGPAGSVAAAGAAPASWRVAASPAVETMIGAARRRAVGTVTPSVGFDGGGVSWSCRVRPRRRR